jgi:Xaa-Pro aminopeptidase
MSGYFGLRLASGGAALDNTVGVADFPRMRQERLAKAKASLKKNGIAAALLFRPENIRYVTGTHYPDFVERLRYCLAFPDDDPILFTTGGIISLSACTWIKPENVRQSRHWAAESPGIDATLETAKQFAEEIKDELKKRCLEKEQIGCDGFLDEPGRQALADAGIKLIDAHPAMLEARAVKTQDEINCFHMAAILADGAHYAMYEKIKPGVRERDIAVAGFDYLLSNGCENVWNIAVSSGGRIGGSGLVSDKVIQVGDVVTIDIVRASYMGYQTCYYRNYVVGRKPNEREKELHKKSLERMYKVIDMIKPGVSTADCAKHWIPATDKGFKDEWGMWCDDLGHGLGLWLYEYPIINRLWSLKHPQIIEKGMTMALECMEYDPLVGRTKLEEMLVVTDNGVEIFTRMPVKDMMIAAPIPTGE